MHRTPLGVGLSKLKQIMYCADLNVFERFAHQRVKLRLILM